MKKIIVQIKIVGINNTLANVFCHRLGRKIKNSPIIKLDKIKSGSAINREAKPLKFDAYAGSEKVTVISRIKSCVIVSNVRGKGPSGGSTPEDGPT